MATVPDCTGLTAEACKDRVRDAGFAESAIVTLDDAQADLMKGPGDLVKTSPAAGTSFSATSLVRIMINPPVLPIEIPAPNPGEDREDYKDRLDDLGIGHTEKLGWDAATDPGDVMDAKPVGRQKAGTEVNITTRGRQKCDLTPWLDDPWESLESQWAPYTGPPWRPVSATFMLASTMKGPPRNPIMKWGSATPHATELWVGFGYRKIAAKHGWGPLDEASTRSVLGNPTTQPLQQDRKRFPQRWTFRGDRFRGLDGITDCERVVVVDYEVKTGDKEAQDFITSYGTPVAL